MSILLIISKAFSNLSKFFFSFANDVWFKIGVLIAAGVIFVVCPELEYSSILTFSFPFVVIFKPIPYCPASSVILSRLICPGEIKLCIPFSPPWKIPCDIIFVKNFKLSIEKLPDCPVPLSLSFIFPSGLSSNKLLLIFMFLLDTFIVLSANKFNISNALKFIFSAFMPDGFSRLINFWNNFIFTYLLSNFCSKTFWCKWKFWT